MSAWQSHGRRKAPHSNSPGTGSKGRFWATTAIIMTSCAMVATGVGVATAQPSPTPAPTPSAEASHAAGSVDGTSASAEPSKAGKPGESGKADDGSSASPASSTVAGSRQGATAKTSTETSRAESRAAAQPIQCSAGSIYSVSGTGQLRLVQGSRVTDIGSAASRVYAFNGLGIGPRGSVAYAYERSSDGRHDSHATIYAYNPVSGTWTNTGVSANTGLQGSLVAGAVDLSDGNYFFGGFESSGWGWNATQRFKLWKYVPSSNSVSYVGYVDTSAGQGDLANGDMAFDASGNLFIVRGNGSITTVFSVTAANLASAGGGKIVSSGSQGFETTNNVNGVAFDAAGKAYLGDSTSVQSFDMPSWNHQTEVTSSLRKSSTDLASCSSPATVMLRKNIDGDRSAPADQFVLSLQAGSTVLGEATTQGNATGIQDQAVGPFPAGRGATLSFSEDGAEGSHLGDYASSATCTVDGKPLDSKVADSGTSGTVTIPDQGNEVVCTITNKAKGKSTLSVKKNFADRVTDSDQVKLSAQVTSDGSTSTVGTPVVTTGTATGIQSEQVAPANITTGTNDTFTVTESAANGLTFDRYDTSYQCVDTAHGSSVLAAGTIASTGTARSVDLGKISTASDNKPRAVECTFTNTPKKAQLKLVKTVQNRHGGTNTASDWNAKLHAQAQGKDKLNFTTGETKPVDPGEYTFSEDQLPGYTQESLSCSGADLHNGKATLQAGDSVTCTFVNADQPGSVTWSKDDGHGHRLSGSVWTLTGPGNSTVTVADCTTGPCNGPDTDPAAGSFKVTGLDWGNYTLTETRAPVGYVVSTKEHAFTLSGQNLNFAFTKAFQNDQAEAPSLPLTGGRGTDAFLITGGIVLVLAAGTGTVLWFRRRKLNG